MSTEERRAECPSTPLTLEGEGRDRLLAQVAFDAVWERDLDSDALRWSGNLQSIFGYSRDEVLGEIAWWREHVHPDDRARAERVANEAIRGNAAGWSNEYRFRRKDGSWAWVASRCVIERDDRGRPRRAVGAMIDISTLKETESRLRFFTEQKRDDPENISLVDGAIARMRNLSQDLHPLLLDEFGLEAALRWYVEREAKRAGLASRLALASLEQRLQVTVETTAFRVTQEALTNVIRHAQARVVDVELRTNGELQLVVRDDGRGFDVAAARRRAALGASLGLISMQERVALAGGDMTIDSAPGRGTSIRVRLPLSTDP